MTMIEIDFKPAISIQHLFKDETAQYIYSSLKRVEKWVEEHKYVAYEPFDGLSSPLHRLTFGNLLLDRLLMQAVRQSPVNFRPIIGIRPLPSTKGRGYMAWGYLTMHQIAADHGYDRKAIECLEWLMQHKSCRYREYSWANHFDFASRGGRYARDESIIVWTALIGQAFLDAFELLRDSRFFEVAKSICRWIMKLPRERTDSGTCISYMATSQSFIHNSNLLGAAMLARTWRHNGNRELLDVAGEAIKYSCTRQQCDGSWPYAEHPQHQWIDNFHTGYNLCSLKCYIENSGDHTFRPQMLNGFRYFKHHFIRPDGCPRYYHNRTYPVDSQCAAQTIETLSYFSDIDIDSLKLAQNVAIWTIKNMQDRDGHFYYRLYPMIRAKAPMLHWAQATTYRALSQLLIRLIGKRG